MALLGAGYRLFGHRDLPRPTGEAPPVPTRRAKPQAGNCKTQTPFLGSWMPIKPSVYCSAPHRPRLYRCAFKNKSFVRLSWPQKGSNIERVNLSGDGEPPPSPELGGCKQVSYLLGVSVRQVGASCVRNSGSPFKYIWREATRSLRYHISHQGGKTHWSPETHVPQVYPSLGGRWLVWAAAVMTRRLVLA